MPGQVFLFDTKARSNSTIDEVYCLHYFFLRQRTLMSKDIKGATIIMGIDADFTGGVSALTKFWNQSFLITKLASFSFPKRKQKYQIKSLFFICV